MSAPKMPPNPNTSIEQLVHRACLTSDKERAAALEVNTDDQRTGVYSEGYCPRCHTTLVGFKP
jgi:hypothetical protein